MAITRYSSFLEMLEAQDPAHVALVFEENGEKKTLTYAGLVQRIEKYPVEENARAVGIFSDLSLESILAMFAYVKAGKQVVMLSPLENPLILAEQVKSSDVDTLIGPAILAKPLSKHFSRRDPIALGKMLFFTSGTTSSAKAVILSERSFCSSAYNGSSLLPLTPDDTLYCCLPLSHVFGLVCSLLWGLSCGATVALSRGVRHFFDDFAYYKPTAVSLVPQMAGFLALHHLNNPELKLVLIGAGGCPKNIIEGLKKGGMRVSFGYGLTETSSGVALSLGDDPYAMSICPDDEITLGSDGEILIHVPSCIMDGYYRDPKSTYEALPDGVLHTGDVGWIGEDGLLRIAGRKKDTLILADGTKIFCPEYEAKLGLLLGLEKDFAIALNPLGQVVLAVGKTENPLDLSDIIAKFNETYPRAQRITSVKYFAEPLPRTQTGKIKRYALQDMFQGRENP